MLLFSDESKFNHKGLIRRRTKIVWRLGDAPHVNKWSPLDGAHE